MLETMPRINRTVFNGALNPILNRLYDLNKKIEFYDNVIKNNSAVISPINYGEEYIHDVDKDNCLKKKRYYESERDVLSDFLIYRLYSRVANMTDQELSKYRDYRVGICDNRLKEIESELKKALDHRLWQDYNEVYTEGMNLAARKKMLNELSTKELRQRAKEVTEYHKWGPFGLLKENELPQKISLPSSEYDLSLELNIDDYTKDSRDALQCRYLIDKSKEQIAENKKKIASARALVDKINLLDTDSLNAFLSFYHNLFHGKVAGVIAEESIEFKNYNSPEMLQLYNDLGISKKTIEYFLSKFNNDGICQTKGSLLEVGLERIQLGDENVMISLASYKTKDHFIEGITELINDVYSKNIAKEEDAIRENLGNIKKLLKHMSSLGIVDDKWTKKMIRNRKKWDDGSTASTDLYPLACMSCNIHNLMNTCFGSISDSDIEGYAKATSDYENAVPYELWRGITSSKYPVRKRVLKDGQHKEYWGAML